MAETEERQTRRTAAVVQSEWRAGLENERTELSAQAAFRKEELYGQEAKTREVLASLYGAIKMIDKVLDLPFATRGNGIGDDI